MEFQKITQLLDLGFTQMVEEATRTFKDSANVLDIILTNQPTKFQDLSVEDGISDHKSVIVEVRISHKINKAPKRKVLLFHKTDIKKFKSILNDHLSSFSKFCHGNT